MSFRIAFVISMSLALPWLSGPTNCQAEPTTEKEVKEKPKLYDREADGNVQIEEAFKIAKAENKRVLLKFGANWCGWCHRLSKCFKTEPEIAAAWKKEGSVLVLIDVDAISDEDDTQHNADVVERYGKPTKHGLPVLVVLDADGQQLHTQDTALLKGDRHDPAKVLAFLEEWKVGAGPGWSSGRTHLLWWWKWHAGFFEHTDIWTPLVDIARSLSSRFAIARARTTPPTSGETTSRLS